MSLPPEVLELILAQIPLTELLSSQILVCKAWHDVISGPQFIPYRKSYMQYRLGVAHKAETMEDMVMKGVVQTSNLLRSYGGREENIPRR